MIVSVLSEETCSFLSQRQVVAGNKNLVGKQQVSVYESSFFFLMPLREENMYLLVNVLEEAMATHSRILAWKIPWTVEPGGLQSMGL